MTDNFQLFSIINKFRTDQLSRDSEYFKPTIYYFTLDSALYMIILSPEVSLEDTSKFEDKTVSKLILGVYEYC